MLTERRRKEIASLRQKKYRVRSGQTIVEGVRAVRAAIASGAPVLDIVLTGQRAIDPEITDLTRLAGAPVHVVDARVFGGMSDVESSQGILAAVQFRVAVLERLLSRPVLLVLDGLRDPGNAGTLIRTAAWFGITGIVTTQGTVDAFSPKVVRASMGAVWEVEVAENVAIDALVESLHAAGIASVAAHMDGLDSRTWKASQPCALILGSEADGVRRELLGRVDQVVAIPSSARGPGTDSLNVAIAGSILLYEMVR